MLVTQSPFTISDFCAAMDRGEVVVNHVYQRNPKVWPPQAKSFLIETILLGYPMPKLSLYQNTDVKTKKTIKEIVDGQQRSMTILDFYHGTLRISRKGAIEEAAGKTYNELDDEAKHKFLSYQLSVDLFVGATHEEIREVFRRINSYTVPLNSEEKRHAKYQGEFKWFVYGLTNKFGETLRNIGAFSEKQLNRMADAKLFSEITHAMLNGITTTNAKALDKLYADNDKAFDNAERHEQRFSSAIELILGWAELNDSAIMKPHQLYTLLLAIIHRQKAVAKLTEYYEPASKKIDSALAVANLSLLAAAIEEPESEPRLAEFVSAGADRTNVAEQRQKRFVWYSRALEPELL